MIPHFYIYAYSNLNKSCARTLRVPFTSLKVQQQGIQEFRVSMAMMWVEHLFPLNIKKNKK